MQSFWNAEKLVLNAQPEIVQSLIRSDEENDKRITRVIIGIIEFAMIVSAVKSSESPADVAINYSLIRSTAGVVSSFFRALM